jgi:hypothetical protein
MDSNQNPTHDKSHSNMSIDELEILEQSCHIPEFNFSSPISSISSNCSSPDPEHTIQPQALLEQLENHLNHTNSSFVSLDELNSLIFPPSDDSGSSACSVTSSSTVKNIEVLETIFEDCYLETPPGTPSTPRPKKPRRLIRLNISQRHVEFDEFKENFQSNSNNDEPKNV